MAKRVLRIMQANKLTLERHTGRRPGRTHDGIVIALRSNIRWCSDHFELACRNGEIVRVLFAIDACDREVMGWLATSAGIYIFTSERGAPFTPAGFRKMVARLGVAADLGFPVHPHMLRHACGFKLANDGVDTRSLQAYLGHRNIQHTVRYTELAPTRFKNFWHD